MVMEGPSLSLCPGNGWGEGGTSINMTGNYPAESHPNPTTHQLSKGPPVTLTFQGFLEGTVKRMTEMEKCFYHAAAPTLSTSIENVNTGRQGAGLLSAANG